MKPHWSGVFPAITTQLHKDGSLNLDATAAHADALIRSGVTGLIFLGSLGEILGVGYVCNESSVAVRGREGTC